MYHGAPLASSCSSVLPLTINQAGPKVSPLETQPFLFQDIYYKAMYLVDTPSQNILQYFQETSKFIRDVLQAGGKNLLFCLTFANNSIQFNATQRNHVSFNIQRCIQSYDEIYFMCNAMRGNTIQHKIIHRQAACALFGGSV